MKIKITIFLIASLMLGYIVWGIPILPFPGWDEIKEKSPNIVIARCVQTTDNPIETKTDGKLTLTRGLIDSDIDVLFVLKGATNLGSAHLTSMYWPHSGEQYLIFSISSESHYNAIETYKIVPLGNYFPTNILVGKTLDEQIQIVFKYRLNNLSKEIADEQEEKARLEEGIKN